MIVGKLISAALFVISSVSALNVTVGSDEIWSAGSTHDVMISDKDIKNGSTVRVELWNRHGEEDHKIATLSHHAIIEDDYAHVTIPDNVVKVNDAFLRVIFDCETADSQLFQIKPKQPLCTKPVHTYTPSPITIWPTASTQCSKHITIHPTPSSIHNVPQINVPSLIFGTIYPTPTPSSSVAPTSTSSASSSASSVTSATRSNVASTVSSSAASVKVPLAGVAAAALVALTMLLF